MRVLVCGSRTWKDTAPVWARLRDLNPDDMILEGGADGADLIAAVAASKLGLDRRTFRPDYGLYGAKAPHIRNDTMLDLADRVIAFWDGKSRGTRSVIRKAKTRGIPVEVISP